MVKKIVVSQPEEQQTDIPDYDEQFKVIDVSLRTIDFNTEIERVREWIRQTPEHRTEIRQHIREQADIQERVGRMLSVTDYEYEMYKVRHDAVLEMWRTEAINYWEKCKVSGFSKQITDKMIENRVVEANGEKYYELKKRLITLQSIRDQLTKLLAVVKTKASDMRKLLESDLKKPNPPNWFGENEQSNNQSKE